MNVSEKVPLHQQVAERVRQMISQGGWRRGDQLPSYRELSSRLGVSYVTVKKAMDFLIDEKVIFGRAGKGMFVHAAQRNKQRELKQIGMLMYCTRQLFFNSDYLMQLFQGIMLEADLINSNVNIFSIKKDGPISAHDFADHQMDGIIMLAVENKEYLDSFTQHEIPVVVADTYHEQIPLDYIACNNIEAAALAVNQVLAKGHKRIAYFGGLTTDTVADVRFGDVGPVVSSDTLERKSGFDKAMQSAGLSGQAVHLPVLGFDEQHTQQAVDHFLSLADRPTAVVCFGTAQAKSFIRECVRRGLSVPTDVSVVAIAGSRDAREDEVAISYVQMPFVDMGRAAVRALESRCKQLRPQHAEVQRFSGQWNMGNSLIQL